MNFFRTKTPTENNDNAQSEKEKRGLFGFRKSNKIKKVKKIPELIARILEMPPDSIVMYDREKHGKTEPVPLPLPGPVTLPRPDSNETGQGLEQGLDQGSEQGLDQGSEQGLDQGSEQGLDTGRGKETEPNVFEFDQSIVHDDQEIIRNVVDNLQTILQQPELGLFGNDEIDGKADSVILIEKIVDEDSEKQNPPKELFMEPFIQVIE